VTAAVDLEQLDAASRGFAAEFLRHHPGLARHARAEPRPEGGSFLLLTLPAAVPGGPVLTVDAGDRGRVRVQWGAFSQEFRAPESGGRSSELSAALSLVEDLLSGAATAYVLRREGRYRGCGVLYDAHDERRLRRSLPPGTTAELHRWDGPTRTLAAN
jgi:hypothetical protein